MLNIEKFIAAAGTAAILGAAGVAATASTAQAAPAKTGTATINVCAKVQHPVSKRVLALSGATVESNLTRIGSTTQNIGTTRTNSRGCTTIKVPANGSNLWNALVYKPITSGGPGCIKHTTYTFRPKAGKTYTVNTGTLKVKRAAASCA